MKTLILMLVGVLSFFFVSSQSDLSTHRLGLVSGFGGQNVDQLLYEINEKDIKKNTITCFQKEKIPSLQDLT